MKSHLITGASIAAIALCTPFTAFAAEKKSESASASPTASVSKERPLPYHGIISSVDQTAKTFTIASKEASRVFKITDKTLITKAGNPATMADVTEKAEVRGSYWRNADGSCEAKAVKIGPKPGSDKSKSSSAAASASPSPSASAKQ